jgi:hypothetical protein
MSKDQRGFRVFAFLFVAAILLSIFGLWYGVTEAQDKAPTQFGNTCLEEMNNGRFRVHFGYYAERIETYSIGLLKPVGSVATLSTGNTVTTAVGIHQDWYMETVDSEKSSLFMIGFANDFGSQRVEFKANELTKCQKSAQVETIATPEPTPPPIKAKDDECPAYAVDSASGNKVCLWSLPKAGDYQ